MDIPTPDQVVASIDEFLARHPAMRETHIGREVNNEPALIGRLRRGGNLSHATLLKIAAFIRERDATLAHDPSPPSAASTAEAA